MQYVSATATNLISGLLTVDPKARLGAKGGWAEIKAHPWFNEINWDKLLNKELKPPKPSKVCICAGGKA